MKSLSMFIVSVIPFLALAQTPPTPDFPEAAEAIDAEALRTRLTGQVLRATMVDGVRVRLEFNSTGYVFLNSGNGYRDTGTWRVEPSRLCSSYQQMGSSCNDVRVAGDTLYLRRTNGQILAFTPR